MSQSQIMTDLQSEGEMIAGYYGLSKVQRCLYSLMSFELHFLLQPQHSRCLAMLRCVRCVATTEALSKQVQ